MNSQPWANSEELKIEFVLGVFFNTDEINLDFRKTKSYKTC